MPYYDPATAESAEDYYLGVAADLVQRFAPVPDPEPADYAEKAERAERGIFDWLSSTQGGSLTSVSGAPGSLSFAQLSTVRSIVKDALGIYYIGGAPVDIRRKKAEVDPYFYITPFELRGPYYSYYR